MGRAGLILSLFLLLGCKTKYIPVETKVTERVSVTDTIIEYQLVPYKDSVAIQDTMSYLSNEYGGSWAIYSGGILHHSLFIFPQSPITIEVPKTITIEKTTEGSKIVEVEKKLSFYQRMCVFCFPIFIFVIVSLAIYFIWAFVKKKA